MRRICGLLAHVSSLPSPWGIGDFGPGARSFVDFLARSGQRLWQVLPLNAINGGAGNSPYSGYSAFAGNPMFISPEEIENVDQDCFTSYSGSSGQVDFGFVHTAKMRGLVSVFERKQEQLAGDQLFTAFCHQEADWLEPYALFAALKEYYNGQPWYEWPQPIRDREESALVHLREELAWSVLRHKYWQYLFFTQWEKLRQYARQQGIFFMGDMPIYVSHDSCDVWTYPRFFELDAEKRLLFAAGAPPDYFSPTGQLWGNPVYDWKKLAEDGYRWWIQRISQNLRLYDYVRIDHFRGFAGYWKIRGQEKTAEHGFWAVGPGRDFFTAVAEAIPSLPLIAEDLGVITPDVRELMREFDFPGMKVLQFAFDHNMPQNSYIPHNHEKNSVVYTGTHDNNTLLGWLKNEVDEAARRRIEDYLGLTGDNQGLAWAVIRLALASPAQISIIPLQDILGLDEQSRMNTPSLPTGNWAWRFEENQLTEQLRQKMAHLCWLFGRSSKMS